MTYADDHAANPCNRCQSPPGVRCEHDEPTPTPAPGLDLDAVERAERAMTVGEWRTVNRKSFTVDMNGENPERVEWVDFGHHPTDADLAGIVALRNAAPALIAEVRALRAEVAKLNDRETGWRDMVDDECRKRISAEYDARAEIARLTAELAAARAEVDCGQDGPCAQAPGCARHWQERNRELVDELAAARAVPAEVEVAIGLVDAIVEHARTLDSYDWQCRLDDSRTSDDAKDDARELSHALRDYDRSNGSTFLRAAIARAISDATAARGTVGGLLAAGEERESRAWSEKGKAPPGSCPFCASRISMVQRDGYFIARCSHRGCGAVGPRMRSVSRAADLFCQPPRREAQGMSCGPIVASPPRPRCSCTHEAGDSRCNVHPTCSECGASTTRPVDGCEACRGPLPKGG